MEKIITTDTLLWLNGAWAGLLVENGGDVMEYASTIPIPLLDRFLTRKVLRKWWGITNRKSLLEQITDKSGYCKLRAGYDKAVEMRELWELPDEVFYDKAKELALSLSDCEYDNLVAVHRIGRQANPVSIIAYDYSRAIMLCEYGYNAGYIKLNESIDKAIVIGRKLQACFSSWEEMNVSYMTGYLFWLMVAEQKVEESWKSRVTALETVKAMEKGPFSLDWNLPLHR